MKKPEYFKMLLVEGKDDLHVIKTLCQRFEVPENFDVIDCEGIEKLLAQISVRYKQSNINTIGIVIDADTDLVGRWSSLKHILSFLEFRLPQEIPKEGFITKNKDDKKVGIWIMPNNKLDGMLEDFMSFLIPKEDRLMTIVDSTLESLEQNNLNKWFYHF
jgi:hypothetical protein